MDCRLEDKLRFIVKATYQHARNLATFVPLYKALLLLLRRLNGGQENSGHAFVAGVIGGYLVFGENNNINQQARPLLCHGLGSAHSVHIILMSEANTHSIKTHHRSICICCRASWSAA